MAGLLTFALALALGFAVSPWWFTLAALPIVATAIWPRG